MHRQSASADVYMHHQVEGKLDSLETLRSEDGYGR